MIACRCMRAEADMGIVLTNWKTAFLRGKGSLSLIIWILVLMGGLLDCGLAQWRGGSHDLEEVGEAVSVCGFW